MPPRRRPRVCTTDGCHELTTRGRCDGCRSEAEQRRGTAADRGYNSKTYQQARRTVLLRDPVCVVCGVRFSTVSDHWPDSRRDLVAMGVPDPDSPDRMRGLCGPCHSSETAREQPGGWNRRN